MFEKIIQRWNAFKKDWAEYQQLRRAVARAWHKMESVRGRITEFYNIGEIKNVKSCIRSSLYSVPVVSTNPMGEYSGRHAVAFMKDCYCSHFGDGVTPCAQTQCSYCGRNHEYVAAENELKALRAKCRTFWTRTKAK